MPCKSENRIVDIKIYVAFENVVCKRELLEGHEDYDELVVYRRQGWDCSIPMQSFFQLGEKFILVANRFFEAEPFSKPC